MSKESGSLKSRVRDQWHQRVTADLNTQPKLLLDQAGEFYRELKIQTRENKWRFLTSIYPAVMKIARSRQQFEMLIEDEYFSISSRKKPNFEDSFQQATCFTVRARSKAAREQAQRYGRIFEMFAKQGVRGREFYGALKRYGGPSGAHKAAKDFFARGKNFKMGTENSGKQEKLIRTNASAYREAEQDKTMKPVSGANRGRAKESPAYPALAAARSRRNYEYLQVTASEGQKTRALSADRFVMECRVEGDPAAEDGWKLISVERLEVLD